MTMLNTDPITEDATLAEATRIVRAAGDVAAERFRDEAALTIERKGAQDWVSEVDRDIETMIRKALADTFPDDGIVGEEHAPVEGRSGRIWVIDPIDGTSLYVNRSPGWCVNVAAVAGKKIVQAITYDPLLDECFTARRDGGAHLNGRTIQVQDAQSLQDTTLFVGHSGRVPPNKVLATLDQVLTAGAMYRQTGSGAMGLASVAAGRVAGYIESQMFAWDCLAGLLLIEEAGGCTMSFDMHTMLTQGGPVIASSKGIHANLMAIGDNTFAD
jgi:myo-inositol-1(or 4)-monophosphatase